METARRNAKILKGIFENEFENTISYDDKTVNTTQRSIWNLDDVIVNIIDYLQDDDTPLSIDKYRNIIDNEDRFTEFALMILKDIKEHDRATVFDNAIIYILDRNNK